MEFAGNALNIIILDACRNNPLSRGMRSADQGLARMDAPMGSFIAYSIAELTKDGSANENCSEHPLRGSSWESWPKLMRSASREWIDTEYAHLGFGFRVALSL
jgi:formylglycine-generating enzyme required for sulfatase activity